MRKAILGLCNAKSYMTFEYVDRYIFMVITYKPTPIFDCSMHTYGSLVDSNTESVGSSIILALTKCDSTVDAFSAVSALAKSFYNKLTVCSTNIIDYREYSLSLILIQE